MTGFFLFSSSPFAFPPGKTTNLKNEQKGLKVPLYRKLKDFPYRLMIFHPFGVGIPFGWQTEQSA